MTLSTEEVRARIYKLFQLGWSCDEHPLDADGRDRTLIIFEALLHELAHSRVIGVKCLHKPKTMTATNELTQSRPNPDRDEIKATAVSILVGDHYGLDLRAHALGNVGGNVSERQTEAANLAEAALDIKTTQKMARSIVTYIEQVSA